MVTAVPNGGDIPVAFFGLSTDTKPTEVKFNGGTHNLMNGTIYYAMDTGDIYMYNAAGDAWVKQ